MVSLGHVGKASSTAPCAPEREGSAVTVGRVLLAVSGVALLAGGVWIDRDHIPVAAVLITAGGFILLAGVALPLVSQIELGAPMLFRVSFAARERRDRLHGEVEDNRGLLVAGAASLCLDEAAAARAVESSLSDAVVSWHRVGDNGLRTYLLCLLVHQCRFEAAMHPLPPPPVEPFLGLPLAQREVLVLVDRAGLGLSAVGKMLGLTPAAVAELRDQALATLSQAGEPR